jgi:hypothetical protein
MSDEASVHTTTATMVNVPSRLNSTENLWTILKWRVKELGPWTKEKLIRVIITASDIVEMPLVNNFVDPMPS